MGLIAPTITLTIFFSLTLSIIKPTQPHSLKNMKHSLMLMFILSMIPLNMLLYNNNELTVSILPLITTPTENIYISITLDTLSLVFIPVALFITWSITEFSIWYMSSDPNINKFIKYLTTFLITMIIIITANNMFQLFIGWEGVGIMSFLLIGWWNMRSNANTAALQAIIYNRIGDVGLIFTTTWVLTFSSVNFQELLIQYEQPSIIPTIGLMAAAMGKSAQFSLHPWLPAAMEGPTPVSALLHSSTMVVAGVFLLIRLYPILHNSHTMKTACLIIGAITTMFAATAAITQHDIKKIIALSTTSQLGLMLTMLGLNQPTLAFLHMTIHSFFKALLFLCSGSFIHNLNNEQDLRAMGNLLKTMPMTSSFTIIASLSLMGVPFLSGFYSKDTMIETMTNSHLNSWALTMTLIATALSASYSMQIILFILTGPSRINLSYHKETKNTIYPLMRLTLMSIFIGGMMKLSTLHTTPTVTMPLITKLMALTMMMVGIILSKDLFLLTYSMPPQKPQTINLFFNQLAFFNIPHRATSIGLLKSGQQVSTELMDLWTMENYGPKGLSKTFTQLVLLSTQQKSMIKNYMTTFSFTLLLLLIIIPT
uniref:NADH-ubiquinone oxidoreductase chain 5 n=1 Tax=Vipera berus TaxID=31155 RepID=A0A343SWD5_VIPBE|nr:NADH dehydrogenase subunit 5 [Vipera berus]YP_010263865.1 NADH dehydrogenase subunit 5 [Echis carinatus]YP_010263878.1 NADH dehydrogenase subunit 5 [Echis coloratus]YP_010384467.1 NADH dehydrogenase subunit 5 [Echis omanensis]AUT77201.1 NADH dehydrogenase subunit 5 [Vipera berus]QHI42779.1 NADH dehydrogenase subunit 5 [Vipera berus]QHI42830.1 NADH dehydrogenase subunit 5 [Vipera berus]UGW52626.1 NADH dehydrogenase subunit 5 [Echis carinatus]UGW52639.1 NADH dehydrogenase subunit 5 [Echis 